MLIKICGITREEEIYEINELKPDYIGFVFANSKRKVTIEQVKKLYKKLNKSIRAVGVFRDNDEEFILNILKEVPLDVVQLHGNEDISFIKSLKEKVTCDIWKAITINSKEDIRNLNKYPINTIVLDGSNPGEGKTFNWNMLRGVNINKRIALAGGINESNVEEGIKSINPTIIDVSSGVEEMDEKGLYKSKDKMEILIKKVRMF